MQRLYAGRGPYAIPPSAISPLAYPPPRGYAAGPRRRCKTRLTSGVAARRVPKGLRAREMRFDQTTMPGPAIRLRPRPLAGATAVPDAGRVVLAAVVAFWFVLVILMLPLQLVQDSWLALVS